jgi:hypothetical protein
MRSSKRNPEGAFQRTPGEIEEFELAPNSLTQIYASYGDLQTRHIRNKCGLTDNRAQLIASLLFGEGGN